MHFYRTVTHAGVSAGHLAAPRKTRPVLSLSSSGSRRRFGGKPRRQSAASPSVPRGVSPHGARLMASAVCRVCRGGGVVASLVYGVEYDGSVEYGVNLEFDVVVVAPKEQKIKKNAN